jgi:hypothetical protein
VGQLDGITIDDAATWLERSRRGAVHAADKPAEGMDAPPERRPWTLFHCVAFHVLDPFDPTEVPHRVETFLWAHDRDEAFDLSLDAFSRTDSRRIVNWYVCEAPPAPWMPTPPADQPTKG